MKKIEWKVGDWCFCEFKLQQIKRVEPDGSVHEVSDGNFSHGGDLTDRCYPLDMKVKLISDHVWYWRDAFHKLNHNSLNHPDLNRELIRRWCDMCDNRENDEKWAELRDQLNEFGDGVIKKVRDVKSETVEGVRLYR